MKAAQSSHPARDAQSLTFFHGARRHGLAVGALELIKVRPHFDLVDDALLQVGESDVPLRGHLQVLYLPRTRGGQTRRLAEQHTVALDELGWVLHLRRDRSWGAQEDRSQLKPSINDEGGVHVEAILWIGT